MRTVISISYISLFTLCFHVSMLAGNYSNTSNLDSLYKVIKSNPNNDTLTYYAWQSIAINYDAKSNTDSFNYAFKRMFEVALNSTNDTLKADAFTVAGMIRENAADFNHSLEYYFKALKIAEKLNYPFAICMITESMAVVYKQLYKVDETLKYLSIAEQYINLPEVKATYLPRGIYLNKAEIFNYANNLDSCYVYIQKAESVTNNKTDVFGASRILGAYGSYYLKKKNYKKAEEYLQKAIAYSDSVNMPINFIEACNINAQLQLEQQNAMLAKKYALRSFEKHRLFVNQVGTLSIEITRLLSEIYSSLKMYDSAFYYSKMNISHRDSVYNTQRLNEIENITQMQMVASIEEEQKKKLALIQQQLQLQKLIRNSVIGAIVFLVIISLLLFSRQKLKRKVEMERMRNRLSRDLHDDIGSTLSSINILSHTAKLSLEKSNEVKAKDALEKINERAGRLLTNMGDIIWNIKPGHDTIEEIVSRMREYATTMFEAKGIDYIIEFPKQTIDCRLTMEVKSNFYLIFKEAVNNLCKYSDATQAGVKMTFDKTQIYLMVKDNGKGFIKEEVTHRGGLSNMEHRISEIKGKIKITSAPTKGTSIELSLPRYC